MKRGPLLPTIIRLVCYAIVATAYVLLMMSLSGCSLLTAAMQAAGIPVGGGAMGAACAADEAVGNWLLWLIGGGVLAGGAGAHVVRKRRARRRALAAQPTH